MKSTKYFVMPVILCASLLASTLTASAAASSTPSTAKPLDTAYLYSSHQDAASLMPGQPNIFSVQFRSRTKPQKALIDIELFDQNGKQLLQKDWDNIDLSVSSSTMYSLTAPKNLAPGVYIWKTAVFTPGWKQQINWYDSAASFAVLGTSTTDFSAQRAVLGGVWQKDSSLTEGETQHMTAYFNTLDQSVGTYLQIDLLDSDNNIIFEKGWDNVYLGYGYDTIKSVESKALSPGNYHWGIGIFSVGRKKLNGWIESVAPFSVTRI